MANDKRPNDKRSKQVSLTEKAYGSNAPKQTRGKRKKKVSGGTIAVWVVALLVIAVTIAFCVVVWPLISDALHGGDDEVDADLPTVSYMTTPAAYSDKVAYYLIGLMGPEAYESDLDMLALVCYDKQQKTVNILQIPPSTYLGESGHWAVPNVGGVWASPKPLSWCETCRCHVPDDQITEDSRHTVCHTLITQKAGSSVTDLIDFVNLQLQLPVDNYYLLPQQGLVELIDLVGGIDVNLEEAMTLAEIDYNAGVQTLDGSSALDYITDSGTTITSEVNNLVHQRQVYVSLFQRLFAMEEQKLNDDVIWPLMKGEYPARTRRENLIADDIDDMCKLIKEIGAIPLESMTVYMLPGEPADHGSATYFSAHEDELVELLNAAFHPYGDPLTEDALQIEGLANTRYADLHEQKLSELAVSQTGAIQGSAGGE